MRGILVKSDIWLILRIYTGKYRPENNCRKKRNEHIYLKLLPLL